MRFVYLGYLLIDCQNIDRKITKIDKNIQSRLKKSKKSITKKSTFMVGIVCVFVQIHQFLLLVLLLVFRARNHYKNS